VKKRKVLFISRRFYPEVIGGGQISAWFIAKAVMKQGYEVFVVTFTEKEYKKEVRDGITIYRVPLKGLRGFPRLSNMEYMYWEMGKLIDHYIPSIQPDIVHCLNVESIPAYALFSHGGQKIPFVATLNGVLLTDFIGDTLDAQGNICLSFNNRKLYRSIKQRWKSHQSYLRFVTPLIWAYAGFHMWLFKKAGKRATLLLPVSKAIKKSLIVNGYKKSVIRIIHNPIDIQKKPVSGLRKSLGLGKKKLVLYMGRIDRLKGIDVAIRAMKSLNNTVLLVIGRGTDETSLKEIARRECVEDKVRFLSHIPYEDIGRYYGIVDAVIMPNRIYEALSRMLLEACSFGVPAVASDRGGNREIIEPGKNGFLIKTFNPADYASALKKILDNPALAKRMGKAGKDKVKVSFSSDIIGKQLVRVYEDALNDQRHIKGWHK